MHVWQSMFSFVVVLRSAMFDTVQSTDTRRHSAVPELDLSIGGTVCVSVTSLQAYHVKARDHGVCTTRQTKDSSFLRPTFLPWVSGEHLVGLQTRRQQVKTAKTRTILTNKPSQDFDDVERLAFSLARCIEVNPYYPRQSHTIPDKNTTPDLQVSAVYRSCINSHDPILDFKVAIFFNVIYLENGTRQGCTYNSRLIGSCI